MFLSVFRFELRYLFRRPGIYFFAGLFLRGKNHKIFGRAPRDTTNVWMMRIVYGEENILYIKATGR